MGMDQPIILFLYPTLTTGLCNVPVVPFPLGLYMALPFPLACYPGHPCSYNVPIFSGVNTCLELLGPENGGTALLRSISDC